MVASARRSDPFDPEIGRRDFEFLGGLSEGDKLVLERFFHRDGQPHVARRKSWCFRAFGYHGGTWAWRLHLGLDPITGKAMPHKDPRIDLLTLVVRCPYCGAEPLMRCQVVDPKGNRQAKPQWVYPHTARKDLAEQRYGDSL